MPNLVLAGAKTLAVGSWLAAAAISFAPVSGSDAETSTQPIPGPDPDLLVAYTSCSQAAEVRLLERGEAVRCSHIYLLLKLSFLPDIEFAHYSKLPAAQRWGIQQRGYEALMDWRKAQTQIPLAANAR